MGDRRHLEFIGPDLARGPVLSGSPQTAAVQLATAIAQLRAPLLRSDDALREHADFIRELAERLFPDFATAVRSDVGAAVGGEIKTTMLMPTGVFNLVEVWLADGSGQGVTPTAPLGVNWNIGTVLREIEAKKHYIMLTPDTGVLDVTVVFGSPKTWRWAVARNGRVHYSDALFFS